VYAGSTMPHYHQRRPKQTLTDPAVIDAILDRGEHLTLAMAADGEPYLATVNYGYDAAQRCFFFHCSVKGKKADILRANPRVWGQILEDLGYRAGDCLHDYRTVQFSGSVTFVDDADEKRRALRLMIDQLEPDPEPVKARFVTDKSVKAVAIVRIDVEAFTAKAGKGV
jgi:uncharacterized protein